MAEISVNFTNKRNGYDKEEVDQFVKDVEGMLQEKATEIANLQQQIADLEARLRNLTGNNPSVEEKVALYDKLMKKMKDDYANLLAPAIAKAKKLEAKAEEEYAARVDQARYCAEGIYKETADRIEAVLEANMDKLYERMDQFMYTRSLPGRFETFMDSFNDWTKKVAREVYKVSLSSKRAVATATEAVMEKATDCRETVAAIKQKD